MTSRHHRGRIAAELASQHGGVVHRRDLRAAGIDHDDVRTELRSGRWVAAGRHTIAIDPSVPTGCGLWWQAVWESGAGAVLDGAAALQASGLRGFEVARLDVAIPMSNHGHRLPGVRLRYRESIGPLIAAGVPRAKPEWACIRAAQWAVSDRQSALLVCLPIQQRIVSAARLQSVWSQIVRSPRRQLLNTVIQDVCDGAQSLGELDFGRLCRRYGLPPPTRQQVRNGARGRAYLDAYWEDAALVVEIDGSHHLLGLNPVDDALRQNELTLSRDKVLRIPLLGLRLAEADFMAQVQLAWRAGRAITCQDRYL